MKSESIADAAESSVTSPVLSTYEPYTSISFPEVKKAAEHFAAIIENRFDMIAAVLQRYESFEVVEDEIARTLDLLKNIQENSDYFQLRINDVTTFLPRNQPLYAFTCFVVIPSLMAHAVYVRIPHGMRMFFPELLEILEIHTQFPNIIVSDKTRLDFLRERSALRVDPETEITLPVTDAVIFTGTSAHADQLRLIFDPRTLFITNGAGHNPVVVSKDADITKAVDAVLTLQLYNQGQDCAAPNSILVHKQILPSFLDHIKRELRGVRVGHYSDKTNRVGPISDARDLVRIQDFLVHNQKWIDPVTPGHIQTHDAIIEPTIICKPLREGGNFNEIFAPIIFVQEYSSDEELALYFENSHYARNAMYVTVYGTSSYVTSLPDRTIDGKVLHDRASVLINKHLHEKGIERGTQPYGGRGYGASSISIGGKVTPKATLPQRDIYENVAKPIVKAGTAQEICTTLLAATKIRHKNIEKILRILPQPHEGPKQQLTTATYIDTRSLNEVVGRLYAKLDMGQTYVLLEHFNAAYMACLTPIDLELLKALSEMLEKRSSMSLEEFTTALYALPRREGSEDENRVRQLNFFRHVYQLLFGKDSGPRLAPFLFEVDLEDVLKLLDI